MKTLDLSKPLQTRNGQRVTVMITNMNNDKPILAVVTDKDGYQTAKTFYPDGQMFPGEESDWDLIQTPEIIYYVIRKNETIWGPCLDPKFAEEFEDRKGILKASWQNGELISIEKL